MIREQTLLCFTAIFLLFFRLCLELFFLFLLVFSRRLDEMAAFSCGLSLVPPAWLSLSASHHLPPPPQQHPPIHPLLTSPPFAPSHSVGVTCSLCCMIYDSLSHAAAEIGVSRNMMSLRNRSHVPQRPAEPKRSLSKPRLLLIHGGRERLRSANLSALHFFHRLHND